MTVILENHLIRLIMVIMIVEIIMKDIVYSKNFKWENNQINGAIENYVLIF